MLLLTQLILWSKLIYFKEKRPKLADKITLKLIDADGKVKEVTNQTINAKTISNLKKHLYFFQLYLASCFQFQLFLRLSYYSM